MTNAIMTLQEKLTALNDEQRKGVIGAKTGQELDAAIAQANLTLAAEEKELLIELMQLGAQELTDDEAEQAAGGAAFRKCPFGHYESTGISRIGAASTDCEYGICEHFYRSYDLEFWEIFFDKGTYAHRENCRYFSVYEKLRFYSEPRRMD